MQTRASEAMLWPILVALPLARPARLPGTGCAKSTRRLDRLLRTGHREMVDWTAPEVHQDVMARIMPEYAESRRLAKGLLKRGLLDEEQYESALEAAYTHHIWNITTVWYLGIRDVTIKESPEAIQLLRFLWRGDQERIRSLIQHLSMM